MPSATLSIYGSIIGGLNGGRPIMPAQMTWSSTLDPVELMLSLPANTNTAITIPTGAKMMLIEVPSSTTSQIYLKGTVTGDTGIQVWPPVANDPLAPIMMPIPNPSPASANLFVPNGQPAVSGVKVLLF